MEIVDVEDSYEKRRHIFKNIWDTAVNLDEKDADITKKPKVIKTLRLDELDRCKSGKKKNQKIKNLRTVCNKLLDFCDKQEADDIKEKEQKDQQTEFRKRKKLRKNKVKKKAKKTRSPPPTDDPTQAKSTSSEIKSEISECCMSERELGQSDSPETKENLDSEFPPNHSLSAESPVHTKNSKQSRSFTHSRVSLKCSTNRKAGKRSPKKSKLLLKREINSADPNKKNAIDDVRINSPKPLQLHKIDVAYSPPPSLAYNYII